MNEENDVLHADIRETLDSGNFYAIATETSDRINFVYTVGTERIIGGEVLIAGIHRRDAQSVMELVVKALAKCPGSVQEGVYQGALGNGLELVVAQCSDEWASEALLAHDYAESGKASIFQAIPPDVNGLFPWQEGADPQSGGKQPLFSDLSHHEWAERYQQMPRFSLLDS